MKHLIGIVVWLFLSSWAYRTLDDAGIDSRVLDWMALGWVLISMWALFKTFPTQSS